jgi:hypothetical protein
MIARCGTTTAVSSLPAAHRLARPAGPQLTIEERGDPGAAPRGRRARSPGEQTAAVLGRLGSIRGPDPVAVGWPSASDRYLRHGLAVAPGPGDPRLDPARRRRTGGRCTAVELRGLVLRLACTGPSTWRMSTTIAPTEH